MAEKSVKKPLVATFALDPDAQDFFNKLRHLHFPPERNFLDAHLTLFHALPDEPWIIDDLKKLIEKQQPFAVKVESVTSLGNGTAFKVAAPELTLIHQKLQKDWFDNLSRQDKQKRNFHITIQNKVDPQVAKKLLAELSGTFKPFAISIYGIKLWRYLSGPWEYLTQLDFGTKLHDA